MEDKLLNKVLIVEDEKHLALGMAYNLRKENFVVEIAEDGLVAIEKWKKFSPHLIILDLMLPRMDGHQVVKVIKSENEKLPILILSAKNTSFEKIKVLSQGVDDYLTKPFDLDELILRVKKHIERFSWYNNKLNSEERKSIFELNDKVINFNNYTVKSSSEIFQLTDQEVKLLKVFIKNPNKVLSRNQLLFDAWGYKEKVETRTIDNFIVRLRKYFENDVKSPQHFKSLRGKGYVFRP